MRGKKLKAMCFYLGEKRLSRKKKKGGGLEYLANYIHRILLFSVAVRLTSRWWEEGHCDQKTVRCLNTEVSPTQFNLALCDGFVTLGFSIYKKSSGREWRVCQYFPPRDSESAS